MYQTIVLGLGFLVFFGGVYLVEHTDKQGVLTSSSIVDISSATANDDPSSVTPLPSPGTYVCDTDTGCQDPVTLTISADGNISMQTSFSDGVEILQESGIWKRVKDGRIALHVTGNSTETYPRPQVISIKYVNDSSLAGLTFDTNLHKDWVRPVFRRQNTQNIDTQ